MDNDASDTDRIGGMHDALCGVSNHRAAQALALISAIDSEPREHNNGYWVRHVAPETTRSCSDIHGAGSQGKIGDDPVRLAHHERPRCAGRLVGECPPFEPLIKRNNTGAKISDLMVGADGRRSG